MKRLLFLLALVPVARAQEPRPPARAQDLPSLLPAETTAVYEFDDLGGLAAWSKETALGRIWAEPEVRHFVEGVETSIRAAFQRFGGGIDPLAILNIDRKDFDGIRVRRLGLALVDASYDGRVELDAVLTMQFRAGQENAARVFASFRKTMDQFLAFPFQETEVAGRKAWRMDLPLGYRVFAHMAGDRLLVTTTSQRLEQLLGALRSGNDASLATAPRFRTARARTGADRYARFGYVDVRRAHDRAVAAARQVLRKDLVDGFEDAWKKLGLDAMDAIAFADVPQGTGFRTELAVTFRERRGIFGLLPHGAPSHRFAAMAPRDCLAYGAEVFDLEATWNGVLGIVGGFDADARGFLEGAVQRAGGRLGVDLKKDVAGALGTEWASFVARPQGGGLVPDVVIVAEVKDRPRLERALDTLAGRLPDLLAPEGVVARTRATHFRGTRIRYLELARDDGRVIPVAPAWAFGDGYLVLSLVPQSVKHALVEKPSVRSHPAFGGLLRSLPPSAVSASYFDMAGAVGYLHSTVAPVLQATQGAINRQLSIYGLELDFSRLPPAAVVTRHLDGLMTFTAVEEDCVRMGYVSSFGAPLLLVPVAAVVLLEAGVRRADRGARRSSERARARARLAEENEMLRRRLADIEAQIAELRRAMAGEGSDGG